MKPNKHEIQIILYCKDHFDREMGDRNHLIVQDLQKLLSYYYGIEPAAVRKSSIINALLKLLPENQIQKNFLEFLEDCSPESCWRIGYYVKEDPAMGKSLNAVPYNYWDAVIYKLSSLISLTVAKFYEGLDKAEADVKLLS